VETKEQIHNRMLSNVGEEYDKSDGSFVFDSTKPAAIEFSRQQNEISNVESKMNIENLTEDELSKFVYQRTGISRKLATKSVTRVVISGAEGSIVSKGNLVGTDTLNFTVLEDAVVSI